MAVSTAGRVGLGVATGGLSEGANLATGGQLFNGGSNVPQRQAVALDPGTQGLLSQQRQHASENTQQIAGETMAGAEARGAGAQQGMADNLNQQATALGMANPTDLSKQLSDRAQRYYQSDIQKLQNQANMGAGERMLSRQQQALQNEQQLNHVHEQAYQSALQNETAKRKARGQMIGSILGIGGMIAGGAAGGPKGVSAGAGIGQAAGEGAGAFQG